MGMPNREAAGILQEVRCAGARQLRRLELDGLPLRPKASTPGDDVFERGHPGANRYTAAVPATILIVDDEREIRELLRYNLEREGYHVLTAQAGEEALSRIFATHPDLVLLDLLLPGLNGLEILREVRAEPSTRDLPIILLTARGAEMDKLLGFERGADDYITKPFSPREVLARVDAILRRARAPREPAALAAGPLTLDHSRREARLDGRELTLTPREFELLYFLARNPGRVFSRDELLTKVWGYDFLPSSRTIDVHIRRLRQAVEEPSAFVYVHTVHGVGYRFEPVLKDGGASS